MGRLLPWVGVEVGDGLVRPHHGRGRVRLHRGRGGQVRARRLPAHEDTPSGRDNFDGKITFLPGQLFVYFQLIVYSVPYLQIWTH